MPASTDNSRQIAALEGEIKAAREKVTSLRKAGGGEKVADYTLRDADGKSVKLSDLFGTSDELMVIHNMGKKCPYCTLWADGFNGLHKHLANRCGFMLVSPDEPAVQKEFARSRGWGFRMLSTHGSSFAKDLGFEPEPGKFMPGVSTFKKEKDGTICRVETARFGPGDDYCAAWHLFDMLDRGANEWSPKYTYG